MKEKISLYVNKSPLYLQDARPSLCATLDLFNEFGHFSGVGINWDKSTLFPLDPQGLIDNLTTQLILVEQFRYLGIQVGRDSARFSDLNVFLLLSQLWEKCAGWVSLLMNLLGCINLLKMIFLSKFLCVSQLPNLDAQFIF